MRDIKAAVDAVKSGHAEPGRARRRARCGSSRRPAAGGRPGAARRLDARRRARRHALMQRRGAAARSASRASSTCTRYAPLFTGYLESLGVRAGEHRLLGLDEPSRCTGPGASRGAIDPCFPSKVALAHVHNLLLVKHRAAPLDCIFFPMLDVLPTRSSAHRRATTPARPCSLTPQTVRAAFTKEGDLFARAGRAVPRTRSSNLEDRPLFARQMFETWEPLLGLSWEENERAIEAGFAALADYERDGPRGGARGARRARARGPARHRAARPARTTTTRASTTASPRNCRSWATPCSRRARCRSTTDLLDRLFGDEVRAGVIRHPLDISDVWKNSFSASSNLKVWAAKFAARHPNLVAVELSNFKCGHDAPIYSTIEEIVETLGHAVLRLQGHRREQARRARSSCGWRRSTTR